MISRRTALAIAEAYADAFSTSYNFRTNRGTVKHYIISTSELYDFLYINNYQAWFCNLSKETKDYKESKSKATRKLIEFILKLHTGETQYPVTKDWSWDQRERFGQINLQNLANDLLNSGLLKTDVRGKVIRNLELDGYLYNGTSLITPEDDVLDKKEEEGVLQSLYTYLKLGNKGMAFHHLSLSEEHYISGKWEDSISNSRKFLECVLQEIAVTHGVEIKKSPLSEKAFTRPVRVREYLEKEGLLDSKETEVLNSVYSLLSETGSHPYMAQNDQARYLDTLP